MQNEVQRAFARRQRERARQTQPTKVRVTKLTVEVDGGSPEVIAKAISAALSPVIGPLPLNTIQGEAWVSGSLEETTPRLRVLGSRALEDSRGSNRARSARRRKR